MRKNLLIAALALTALAGCTSDEYVGDTSSGTAQGNHVAINFSSGFKAVTRADLSGSGAATKLGNAMKVYGVKQNRTTATNYDKVFVNYSVKYSTDQAGKDEYNNGWYYVGAETGQTIKYWDYASDYYHFAAGSPVANFSYSLNSTTGDIESATVTGFGGRLNHTTTVASNAAAVYIADPKIVAKTNYNSEVEFTFRSMQTKVRVGIYETIPGYKITSIKFYNNDATPAASNYITLNCATDNYFQGGSNVVGTIAYNWTTPTYTFAYSTEEGKKPTLAKYWEGGQFNGASEYSGVKGVPATSSAEATTDNLYGTETNHDTNGYFIVMPTPSATAAAPLTIKCDYDLTSLDTSGEIIKVTGATATIPAAYTKWNPNTAYTYLFKISDNTNGSTGTPSTDPAGLYPITFDAVVVNDADATQNYGTETTVSTPSITVYQNGDVVTNGITYQAGSITVHAYEGANDVTDANTTEWNYVELTGAFDYTSDYEKLGANGAATSWTNSKLTTVKASKTYVIKCTTSNGTAYFVLVVTAAETGPTN